MIIQCEEWYQRDETVVRRRPERRWLYSARWQKRECYDGCGFTKLDRIGNERFIRDQNVDERKSRKGGLSGMGIRCEEGLWRKEGDGNGSSRDREKMIIQCEEWCQREETIVRRRPERRWLYSVRNDIRERRLLWEEGLREDDYTVWGMISEREETVVRRRPERRWLYSVRNDIRDRRLLWEEGLREDDYTVWGMISERWDCCEKKAWEKMIIQCEEWYQREETVVRRRPERRWLYSVRNDIREMRLLWEEGLREDDYTVWGMISERWHCCEKKAWEKMIIRCEEWYQREETVVRRRPERRWLYGVRNDIREMRLLWEEGLREDDYTVWGMISEIGDCCEKKAWEKMIIQCEEWYQREETVVRRRPERRWLYSVRNDIRERRLLWEEGLREDDYTVRGMISERGDCCEKKAWEKMIIQCEEWYQREETVVRRRPERRWLYSVRNDIRERRLLWEEGLREDDYTVWGMISERGDCCEKEGLREDDYTVRGMISEREETVVRRRPERRWLYSVRNDIREMRLLWEEGLREDDYTVRGMISEREETVVRRRPERRWLYSTRNDIRERRLLWEEGLREDDYTVWGMISESGDCCEKKAWEKMIIQCEEWYQREETVVRRRPERRWLYSVRNDIRKRRLLWEEGLREDDYTVRGMISERWDCCEKKAWEKMIIQCEEWYQREETVVRRRPERRWLYSTRNDIRERRLLWE